MELIKFVARLFTSKEGPIVILCFIIGLVLVLPSIFGINMRLEGEVVIIVNIAGISFFIASVYFAKQIQDKASAIEEVKEKVTDRVKTDKE